MNFFNVEIKAKCADLTILRKKLLELGAKLEGTDHQIDTYYHSEKGKLKLRQGNIENAFIFYDREKKKDSKLSAISLYKLDEAEPLKNVLDKALEIDVVVDKKREIYWIDNVKFHLDTVMGLGEFVEIEAIDYKGTIGREKLLQLCDQFVQRLEISKDDLIVDSYSDLLTRLHNQSIFQV